MFIRPNSCLVDIENPYWSVLGCQRSPPFSNFPNGNWTTERMLHTKIAISRLNNFIIKLQEHFVWVLLQSGSFTYKQQSTVSTSRYWFSTIHALFSPPPGGYLSVASLGENSYLDLIFGSCGFVCPFFEAKSCLIKTLNSAIEYTNKKPKNAGAGHFFEYQGQVWFYTQRLISLLNRAIWRRSNSHIT